MKVAIYSRVSTDRQETLNQLAEMRRFAGVKGWEIQAEYVDHETGRTSDRSKFQHLFEAARRREFDVVLFWALDRFSREGVLETLKHLNLLSDYGVGFYSYTEQYLDTCGMFKDAVIAILATIAKQESARISERVKAGLARAKQNGTRSGKAIGRPRRVFSRDKLVELRNQGMSWPKIARKFGIGEATAIRAFQSGNPNHQISA